VIGFQVCIMGVLADLISSNRRLIEQVLDRVKRIERGELPPPIEGDERPQIARGASTPPLERGVEPQVEPQSALTVDYGNRPRRPDSGRSEELVR
jgi:hypothetical protein